MKNKRAFGKALKQARKAKDLTQEDFSITSSRTYLSTLERGLKSPTLEKVETLASTMKIHPLTLLVMAYFNAGRYRNVETLLDKIVDEIDRIESETP